MSEGKVGSGAASPGNSRRTPVARLFFALWPDRKLRETLSAWADALHGECGGRRVRDEQLHVTLVFLGDVPLERIRVITDAACRIAARPFTLRVSGTGYWPKKHLAFALTEEVPVALAHLVKELRFVTRQAGVNMQERSYFPHVTLLRNAKCGGLSHRPEAFDWHAEEFVLVRSTLSSSGSRYDAIGQWRLTAQREEVPLG